MSSKHILILRRLKHNITKAPMGLPLAAVTLICFLLSLFADKKLVVFLRGHQDYLFINLFEFVTAFGDATWWLSAFGAGLCFCIFILKTNYYSQLQKTAEKYKQIFLYLILSCLISGIIHHVIKIILGRYRPRYLFSENLYGVSPFNFDIAYNSFPSGHTQTIFSICIALSIVYPRYSAIFWLLAVAVGASRIILLAHYPSDVIFGAYLGVMIAILLHRYHFHERIVR